MSPEIRPKSHYEDQVSQTEDNRTPEPGQFSVKHDFLANLVGKFLKKGSELAYSDLGQILQHDAQFINKIVQIYAKSQATKSQKTMKQTVQIIDDRQCQIMHEMAQRHSNANRFNQYSDSQNIPPEKLCMCGCNRAQGDPLSFCENQTKQYFFGPGIILFFFMIRKIILLLIILACIYGIFSLATNIQHGPLLQGECKEDDDRGSLFFLCEYKLLSTVRNKIDEEALLHIQLWLGLIICIFWILGIRIVRSLGRQLNKKIDSRLDSSSDYCIQVSNLPLGGFTEAELLKYLRKLWRKYKGKQVDIQIKSVQIIYNISEVRERLLDIIRIANKIMKMVEPFSHNQSKDISLEKNKKFKSSNITEQNLINKREQKIMQIEHPNAPLWKIPNHHKYKYIHQKTQLLRLFQDLEQYRDKFIHDQEFRKQLTTDMAFVEFSDPQQQSQFIKHIRQYRTTALGDIKDYLIDKFYQNQQESNLFKGKPIKIMRAPEPSDINWVNCQKKFSYKRVGVVWLITLLVIGTSFGVLMLIRFLRSNFPELNQFSIFVSISIQIFNRIIWKVLCACIQIEENNTKTDNIISIMNKSMFAQTINITVLPLIMNIILKENIYGPQGLIGMTLDYQFVVLFMMFQIHIVNIQYQFKRLFLYIPPIRNWIIRRKAKVIGQIDTTEQIEPVLKYYEGPGFPIAGGYIYMTAVIYQGMFFLHLQPTLIFCLIFNMCCFYAVNKYLLLRRCKISELLDFIIFQTSCSMLQHAPLLYAIGSTIFLIIFGNLKITFFIPNILILVFWLLHMINPKKIMHTIIMPLVQHLSVHQQTESFDRKEGQDQIKVIRNTLHIKGMTKRKECYYKNSGLNDLLNFEGKLVEAKQGQSKHINKLFCERFNLNIKNKLFIKTSKTKYFSSHKKNRILYSLSKIETAKKPQTSAPIKINYMISPSGSEQP